MRVNVYIRKENEELWNRMENKSLQVNNWLEGLVPQKKSTVSQAKAIEIPKASRSRQENGVCKMHGTPLTNMGKCLQKGCKNG